MKKRLALISAATSLLIAACSGGESDRNCVINGTIEGWGDPDTLVLCIMTPLGNMPIDTATVTEGKFTFDVSLDKEAMGMALVIPIVNSESATAFPVLIEPGAKFSMAIHSSPDKQPTFEGSRSNITLAALEDEGYQINLEVNRLVETIQNPMSTEQQRDEADQKIDSMNNKLIGSYISAIKDNAPSLFSDFLLGQVDRVINDSIRADIISELSKKGGDEMPNFTRIKNHMLLLAQTEPGKHFTDFSQSDKDGNQIHLAEVVEANKLTLVDFWASWCAPCRAEMPFIVDAYEKYHGKGLEIIGVSLDENREAWLNAVGTLGMKWPQVSDLQGWRNVAAQAYAVEAIPGNILIGQDGIIVGKNLRGDDLAKKIDQILK